MLVDIGFRASAPALLECKSRKGLSIKRRRLTNPYQYKSEHMGIWENSSLCAQVLSIYLNPQQPSAALTKKGL